MPSQRSWCVRAIASAIWMSGEFEPARISAPFTVCDCMIRHSSASSAAGLEQDVVRDPDLADVVERAGVAQHVRPRGVEADAQREALAEVADAMDVLARVAVA